MLIRLFESALFGYDAQHGIDQTVGERSSDYLIS